jgi:CubicO group peptidase (beta-lactamase class C family)
MKTVSYLLILIGLLLSLLCGCAAQPPQPAVSQVTPPTLPTASGTFPVVDYWPTQAWRSAAPEAQGMDPQLLEQARQAATQPDLASLQSLLIIRHGYIVSETYYQGQTAATRHELYSVTKSFTGTLVGIAANQGWLDIHQPVLATFPERQFDAVDARKQSMTVENLLTMTAGLDWVESDSSYTQLYRSSDWVRYMLNLPVAADPGSVFLYNSGASHVLSAVVNAAVRPHDLDTFTFAKQVLFTPLGIDPQWDRDSQSIPIGGWGLQLTPRDMAKLGFLYLHAGIWDGKQLVPAAWVKTATQKHAPTLPGDLGYGYQWWVYPLKGDYARYPAYAALGRFGQTIFVVPDLDLIIVTTAAQLNNHDAIFKLIDTYIVPAVR